MIRLKTPVSREDIRALRVGEKVLLTGTVYTARDQAHIRLQHEKSLPFDLEGAAIYYVGPTPERPGFVIGSSGPTSAYRMDSLAIPLMERGVRIMIGKGDRSLTLIETLKKHDAVYLMATGGAGALLAACIKSKKVVLYEDLGPEAVHALEVEDFPCYVAYDVHGGNIFKQAPSH